MDLQGTLNRLEFALREKGFGRLRMRCGLPRIARETAHREEAYYRLLLSTARSMSAHSSAEEVGLVIDVGCRNWSYAPALAAFFPQAHLLGVEVDAKRRYWNLFRRMDYAQANADALGRGRAGCFFEDFLNLTPEYLNRYIRGRRELQFTFFYPFVSASPCLSWGLPPDFAHFAALLKHAKSLSSRLRVRATVLSVHQGEWEAELARTDYATMPLVFEERVLSPASFEKLWPAPYHVYLMQALL